jgi:hypothetical protein
MGLSFKIIAGPRQRITSDLRDWITYTVSWWLNRKHLFGGQECVFIGPLPSN